MSKIEDARKFLKMIGMPKEQQTDICCYVILAMAGINSFEMLTPNNKDTCKALFRLFTSLIYSPSFL